MAVARALVFEPDLVLMDDPLGALDKNLREEMQYEIKHLHEELGVTIVYVTHDQSEALTMVQPDCRLQCGVIQQLAKSQRAVRTAGECLVAQFIGENNRLCGRVKSVEGSIATWI